MIIKMKSSLLAGLCSSFLVLGCGADSNFNAALFADGEDKERFDVLEMKARFYYDEGKFSEAKEAAEKAYALSPHSERAAQTLGFIYLAEAGIDIFSLLEQMIELSSKKTSASGDSLSVLSDLSGIINLSDDDLKLIGDYNDSSNPFFSSFPVYLPNKPGSHLNASDPRAEVSTLASVNKAISVVCPFVDPSLFKDLSHERYNCTPSLGKTSQQAQSYFLFSMAHLVETLAFNVILLYSDTEAGLRLAEEGQSVSNLFKRANNLKASPASLEQMGDYAQAVVELKEVIEGVFDTSPGSMLYETLLNLRMVVSSLNAIEGIPESVSKNLQGALDSIEKTAAQAGASSDGLDGGGIAGQSEALKQQLNEKVVKEVNENIDKYLENFDEATISDEERENATKMCAAANTLIKDAVGINPPEQCENFK